MKSLNITSSVYLICTLPFLVTKLTSSPDQLSSPSVNSERSPTKHIFVELISLIVSTCSAIAYDMMRGLPSDMLRGLLAEPWLAVEVNRPLKERGRLMVIEPSSVRAVRWKGWRGVVEVFCIDYMSESESSFKNVLDNSTLTSLMLIEPETGVFTSIVVRRDPSSPPGVLPNNKISTLIIPPDDSNFRFFRSRSNYPRPSGGRVDFGIRLSGPMVKASLITLCGRQRER